MDALLEILTGLHPEVDFEACNTLVDDSIIDSFDIVSIVSEINDAYDVVIQRKSYRIILTPPGLCMS